MSADTMGKVATGEPHSRVAMVLNALVAGALVGGVAVVADGLCRDVPDDAFRGDGAGMRSWASRSPLAGC